MVSLQSLLSYIFYFKNKFIFILLIEMAEKHNTVQILNLARGLIQQLKTLIDKKNDNSIEI